MAISKSKKKEVIDSVNKVLSEAVSVVFVNFKGLSVAMVRELRSGMRAKGLGYKVAKKTLVRKALGEMKFEGTMPELPGELALAYGEDPVLPAKEIATFGKKQSGKLSILGGIFEGRYLNALEMQELAAIPEPKVLLGMLVNVVSSPMRGLVIALDAIEKSRT